MSMTINNIAGNIVIRRQTDGPDLHPQVETLTLSVQEAIGLKGDALSIAISQAQVFNAQADRQRLDEITAEMRRIRERRLPGVLYQG